MKLALLLVSIFVQRTAVATEQCNRRLYETNNEKTPGNNGFVIEISSATIASEDSATSYLPGDKYTVKLRGWQTKYTVTTFRGFGIYAQFEDNRPAGKFELFDTDSDARIAPSCRRAGVSHANLRPKTSAHVLWRAPFSSDAGCVIFRATVITSKQTWYADDGPLTKKFCLQEGYKKVEVVDDPNVPCCACDEAKYDLEFTGLWSKETHPKDYPSLEHLTHFTDMLGASHSNNYTMWKFGTIATDGLKEIAEWGNTYKGEQEMKANATEIRTLMKIKGLWYPEVQGKTRSTFQVNRYHHLVSLAAMFGPSPDWCVGVSSINLCLPDCTWAKERVFELLPFDAGTDNGPSYMSPNNPADPRVPVHPITTKLDKLSPFYNEESDVIPPLAKLVLTVKEVTKSECKTIEHYKKIAFNATNTSEDEEYKDRRECMVTTWEPWSLCSATCGKGIRMRSRVYVFPIKAQMFHCHRQVIERQFCNAAISECKDSDAFNSKCAVSNWNPWSDCSVTCGEGVRSRTRNFKETTSDKSICPNVNLTQSEKCVGENGEDCLVTPDPLCKATLWSEWSPCSASCGDGVRVRTRLLYYTEHEQRCSHISLIEKDVCQLQSCRRLLGAHMKEICEEEKLDGQCAGKFPRYWYNSRKKRCERFIYTGCKGNRNQFETEEECKRICVPGYEAVNKEIVPGHQLINEFGVEEVEDGGEKVDCVVSEWTPWGNCSVTCGVGKRHRSRQIEIFPRNGGKACPEHLVQAVRCELKTCGIQLIDFISTLLGIRTVEKCQLGQWSPWSPCPTPCGGGKQHRRRTVIKPRNFVDDGSDPICSAPETATRFCPVTC
ncbi:unnamed protein product [Enterobius vermicularis]|uniref:Spondin-1 n=1 Tax=Enterobius vermicularis TaxID=51028 RepID=A0A0N4UZU2_ENTVE|nr:unnamed protein product [Enterobius vermicularis]